MKLKECVLQLLFPRRCPVCDEIVSPFGEKICRKCLPALKLLTPPWCMKCGKKLNAEGEFCADCQTGRHKYVRGRALYEYSSVAASVYRMKYQKRREYAEYFGEEIAYYLQDFIKGCSPQALIPVPLHKKRQNARGYNQSECLARAIGSRMGIAVRTDLIQRTKNTKPLKYQNPAERQNNLKKAFNIQKNDVKLSTVIIVDDIYTTGSTVDEMTKVLQQHGVKEVYYVALACGAGI